MLQESNRVELKEKLNEKLEKEICAFLNNREGGVLYIGIADDGTVIGVLDADSLQKKVAERIRDNILPSALGLYDVTSEEMDGKTVIKVIVSSGTPLRIGAAARPFGKIVGKEDVVRVADGERLIVVQIDRDALALRRTARGKDGARRAQRCRDPEHDHRFFHLFSPLLIVQFAADSRRSQK